MVNFENLVVEELLFEVEAQQAAGTAQQAAGTAQQVAGTTQQVAGTTQQAAGNDQNQEATKQNWSTFFKDRKNLDQVKLAYNAKFTNIGIAFPEDNVTTTLIQAVHNHASRDSGLNAVGNENVKKYFPIVDLLARLFDTSTETKNAKPDFESVLKKFLTELNQFRGIPSDFPPKSMMGKRLIDQFNKSLPDIGTITLDKEPYPTNSIWFAVMTLLAARKKYRSNKIDLTKVPSSEKYVEDLIINFEKYAGGTNLVPRQFQSLYGDNITPQELVNIGKLANDYMEREAERLGKEIDKSKKKQTLLAFIKNAPLIKMSVPTNESFGFESFFDQIFLEFTTSNRAGYRTTQNNAQVKISKQFPQKKFRGKKPRYGNPKTKSTSEPDSSDQATGNGSKEIEVFDWTNFLTNKVSSTDTATSASSSETSESTEGSNAETEKVQKTVESLFDVIYQSCLSEDNFLFEVRRGNSARKQLKAAKEKAKGNTDEPTEMESEVTTVPATDEKTAQAVPNEPTEKESNAETAPAPTTDEKTAQAVPDAVDLTAMQLDKGYILKNIKEQPSQENNKAKPLYDALLKLANYIRSQKQRDITGAINSAAGVMRSISSIGGPTMR